MIRKLVVFGIIVIVAILIVPNLLKDNSHVPALGAIKDAIEYVSTNHGQGNGTSSVGYGVLANSNVSNSAQSSNTGVSSIGKALNMSNLPQVIKQTYTGQVVENTKSICQVSVPDMEETINGQTEIAHIIQVPNCNLPVNQPVQVTTITPKQNGIQSPDFRNVIKINPYTGPNNDDSTNSNPLTSQAGSNPIAPPYFQTVQLNAVNQGTSALLSYDDTTGKTIQVTVTMKNSEKILFSGTFYSSQFHTEVNDIPDTPHIIEMTIQNAVYGTLHASIYAPSNIQNSTISGIFTNSTR